MLMDTPDISAASSLHHRSFPQVFLSPDTTKFLCSKDIPLQHVFQYKALGSSQEGKPFCVEVSAVTNALFSTAMLFLPSPHPTRFHPLLPAKNNNDPVKVNLQRKAVLISFYNQTEELHFLISGKFSELSEFFVKVLWSMLK